MGLMLSSVPNLNEAESLRNRLNDATRKLSETEELLRQERFKMAQIERGVQELRLVLSPLYQALQHVFGEIDTIGVSGSSSSDMDPRKAAIWQSWKQKMPGIPAKFIDALLLHGALTQSQLRLHAQCAMGSVAGVVSQLYKAGLINKNGGKISLKEL
jgi:hypothetical protein